MVLRVPTITQRSTTGGSGRPASAPAADTSIGEAVERTGARIVAAGKDVEKYQARKQKLAQDNSKRVALTADQGYASELSDILHNPEDGYYSSRGAIASDGYGDVDKKITELRTKWGGTINSEDLLATELYQASSTTRERNAGEGASRHARDQGRLAYLGRLKAGVGESINDAVNNRIDSDAQNDSIERGKLLLDEQGEAEGWDAETTRIKKESYLSVVHEQTTISFLATNTLAAKLYYDGHKDEIDATKRPALEEKLKNMGVRDRAQLLAETMFDPDKTIEDMTKKLNKEVKDVEVRDATNARLKTMRTEQNNAEARVAKERVEAATRIIETGGTIDDIDPLTWSAMKVNEREAIQAHQKRVKDRQEPETDFEYYATLGQMAVDDPGAFIQMDLNTEARSKLSNVDFKHFVNEQIDLSQQMASGGGRFSVQEAPSLLTPVKRLTENYMQARGLKKTSQLTKVDKQRLGVMINRADNKIRSLEEQKRAEGKTGTAAKALPSEIEQILGQQAIIISLSEGPLSRATKLPAGAILPDDLSSDDFFGADDTEVYVPIEQIAPATVDGIKARLVHFNGSPLTDTEIANIYALKVLEQQGVVSKEVVAEKLKNFHRVGN